MCGVYGSLVVCATIIVIRPYLRAFIMPPVKQWVGDNTENLLHFTLYIFVACSLVLMIIFWWIRFGDKQAKRNLKRALIKLIAPDYYIGYREPDFYNAIKASLTSFTPEMLDLDEVDGLKRRGRDFSSKVRRYYIERRIKEAEGRKEQYLADYEKDTSDGIHRVYFTNGRLKVEVAYLDGKLSGPFRMYYEDGTLRQEKFFKDGKLNGIFRAYDEWGIPYFEISYKDGIQHGSEKVYNKFGGLMYMDTYYEGKKINHKLFDDSGELISDYDFAKPPLQEGLNKEL